MEQKLKITPDGKYPKVNLNDIDNGSYTIVEKVFAEAKLMEGVSAKTKEPYRFYSCKVKVDEQEVYMTLKTDDQAKIFNSIGGIGDRVKITATKNILKNKAGKDFVKTTFTFEPA